MRRDRNGRAVHFRFLRLFDLGALGRVLDDIAHFQHFVAQAVGLGEVLCLLGGGALFHQLLDLGGGWNRSPCGECDTSVIVFSVSRPGVDGFHGAVGGEGGVHVAHVLKDGGQRVGGALFLFIGPDAVEAAHEQVAVNQRADRRHQHGG